MKTPAAALSQQLSPAYWLKSHVFQAFGELGGYIPAIMDLVATPWVQHQPPTPTENGMNGSLMAKALCRDQPIIQRIS